ncbi:MAG: lectin-like protein, partial [Flavobacteriaceae bacterium]|nr:lectin-like protein [Flavobacteriaceae bacterium]
CMDIPEAKDLMAMDDCAGNFSVEAVDTVQSVGDEGCGDIDITRTWTAVDNCGNETVHTQVIQVRDMEAPELTGDLPEGSNENDACAPESDEELAALGVLTASDFAALYTDDCNTVVVNRVVNIDGDDCKWIMWVRYDVSDSCGNEATPVKLWYQGADATAPEITKAEDATAECDGTDDALNAWLLNYGGNTATDCGEFDGEFKLTWTNDYNSRESTEGDGCTTVTTVTFTATDACGNESSTTSTFTVEDTTVPVFVDTDCDTTVELDFDPNNGPGDKDGFTYLGEYEGHYYYITTETMSATDGNILVGNNGGYMATITDADENQWIYDAAVASNGGNNIRFWIGLTDVAEEGVFLWMDGTTFDYENWHNGEPNNLNGNEHCVELGRFNSSTWNDEPCTNQKYILMEVDGASLKEEAAYTDACAGDGTVTDYSDVITVENSNTGLGYLVDSCVSGYFWEIGGYDAEGYAIYVLPGYDATLYNITFNIATSQWEMDWGTYDNGIVFTSTGGYTIDCNDTSTVSIQSGFYCNDPGEQVFSCYDTNSGEDVYTLERTFTATDGCNESSCTVTYTWTEQSAQATSTADASEDALPQTPAPISSSSQAAPGEGEDMGVDLDFTAFPVPFDRDVNVKFNFEFDTDVTIEVHDTRGLLVKSMTLNNVRANTEIKKSFDLSRAGDQLFYITVTTNQGSVTKKAVSSNMKRR